MLTEEQQEQKNLRDAALHITVVLPCCMSDPGQLFPVLTGLLRCFETASFGYACVSVINIDLSVYTCVDPSRAT